MTGTKRLKVFLCHAHSDATAVRDLFLYLRREGVDVWLDKEKLLPGADWDMEIRKAVRESDVVVVCLSKQFNQAGYRQKEVRIALDTAMEKPEGEIFIIPARLEECDTLESLRKWHWVDLFEVGGRQRLIQALRVRAASIGAGLRRRRGQKPDLITAQREDTDSDVVEAVRHTRKLTDSWRALGNEPIVVPNWPREIKQGSSETPSGIWIDLSRNVWRGETNLGRIADDRAERVLSYLVSHKNKTCDRASLYIIAFGKGYAWDTDIEHDTQMEYIIASLREFVEIDPKQPKFIQEVSGGGYVLKG
jgi:DNA-binding response OmpR family regulator